jgi:hypothetical protein
MPKVRLRPWRFGKGERVRLYWLCSPYRGADGNWVVRAYFLRENSPTPEVVEYPWGTLPLLRTGRLYVDGDLVENDPRFSPQKTFISDIQNGTFCRAYDIPRRLYDFFCIRELGDQRLWKFWSNRTLYYIPCLELIRAFLTPSKTLANQLLRPNGLDFLIDEEEINDGVLEMALSGDVPRGLVTNETAAHLSWLRHNEAARGCWESTYNSIFAEAIASAPRHPTAALSTGILVELRPPVGKSCELSFTCVSSGRASLILEITAARGLDALPFETICYTHPSLKTGRVVEGVKRTRRVATKDNGEDLELDAQRRSARVDVDQPIADAPATSLGFRRTPKFERKAKRETLAYSGGSERADAPSSNGNKTHIAKNDTTVSTVEPFYGGEIQPVDFIGVELAGATNSSGLKDFLKAVRHIIASHSQPRLRCGVVEIPGSRAFCRLADGSKRSCAVIEVTQEGVEPCYILEIARPDNWSVSTLFIRVLTPGPELSVGGLIAELLEELVKRDGHWNAERLDSSSSLRVSRLKHVAEHSAWVWSRRILERLVSFGFAPEEAV